VPEADLSAHGLSSWRARAVRLGRAEAGDPGRSRPDPQGLCRDLRVRLVKGRQISAS
jgi:hypothetical protein